MLVGFKTWYFQIKMLIKLFIHFPVLKMNSRMLFYHKELVSEKQQLIFIFSLNIFPTVVIQNDIYIFIKLKNNNKNLNSPLEGKTVNHNSIVQSLFILVRFLNIIVLCLFMNAYLLCNYLESYESLQVEAIDCRPIPCSFFKNFF